MYGFKVSDELGSYTRWFNSDGTFEYPMTIEMEVIAMDLAEIVDFKDAAREAKQRSTGSITYQELTEQDWKKTKHPIKKLMRKIFG